jgi:transposase
VVLFEDETILTERPPLRSGWALAGEQAKVSITGNRGKRVLYGVLNPKTGKLVTAIDEKWNQEIFKVFLNKIKSCFRGWNIILFLDRGTIHKAKQSMELARDLKIELRWLPVACPELNPVEELWLHLKGEVLSNRIAKTMIELGQKALDYLNSLSRRECRQKAGVLSNNFWLAT